MPADDDNSVETAQPTTGPADAVAVDTGLRFRPEELPAGYERRMTVKRAVTESLVAAEERGKQQARNDDVEEGWHRFVAEQSGELG